MLQGPAGHDHDGGQRAEAAAAAAQLGGRVVLKAEVEGLVHKTDARGVRLDLRTRRKKMAEATRR